MEDTVLMTVSQVFSLRQGTGPVHAVQDGISNLSWCGAKSQFRHRTRPGAMEDVTCPKCLRRLALGQPLAWKGR